MLIALRISNFAVIDEAEVEFGAGLNVLTGETGAGKSIVVDALGLVLGGRAEADVIRAGADEATVEGIFEQTAALGARLAELGLPTLGDEVSVRRVVGRSGRGRAWVNGALVTVGVLARLMRGRVDIAGQNEHVGLFDGGTHRALLDAAGGLGALLASYKEALAEVRGVEDRIEALGGDDRTAAQRMDFLRFQLDEVDRLSPQVGEDARLEDERRRLSSAERLRHLALGAETQISSGEATALELLGRALGQIQEAARLDDALCPVQDRLGAAVSELEEVARIISRYAMSLDGDPGRLLEVDERLDALKRLCRKHGADLRGVLDKRDALADELGRLENRHGLMEALQAERARAEAGAWHLARALTSAREAAGRRFGEEVTASLGALALPGARFEVQVAAGDVLQAEGGDGVEFLFSANAGEPPRPLAKVASGGEASRLLLAMKKVLAGTDGGETYVLDEADAGVSGGVAEVVGRMIREVSAHRQVLCITHLPQVAAFADRHLSIRKARRGDRTVSSVVALEAGEARTLELARMLAGVEVTREAMGAARALVRSAQTSRPSPRPRRAPRARQSA
jgi:DNA repair protein RecN (Recombination protein N)